MELPLKSIALTIVIVTVLTWAWRVLNWVWLRPKKLEKFLRQQGLKGNSYRLLFGDLKENSIELKEAKARPLSLDDDIAIRVNPFLHKLVNDYGMYVNPGVYSFNFTRSKVDLFCSGLK